MDFYFVFLLNIPNIEECDGYLSIILKDVICYEIILFKTVQALVKRKFKSTKSNVWNAHRYFRNASNRLLFTEIFKKKQNVTGNNDIYHFTNIFFNDTICQAFENYAFALFHSCIEQECFTVAFLDTVYLRIIDLSQVFLRFQVRV